MHTPQSISVHYQPGPLVAPSLLSADFANLSTALAQLEQAKADWVHLDIMDGHFVPNLTFGPPVIKHLRAASGLPFDVHLMITEPERWIEAYVDAGANLLTVHVEACTHLQRTLQAIRQAGALAGVSLNPATPIECLKYVLDDLDLILVMSVNPGFGGQSFIPSSLQKLRDLRNMIGNRPIFISVDGGITPGNVKDVREAGAQVLVAGSAVFGSKEPMHQVIASLR